MPIQIGGIISGLDTDTVIQQLLEIDNRTKKNLETKKTDVQSEKDLFGELNTKLLAFKTESDKMLLSSTFQKRSAASTNTAVATATVTDGATPGTYTLLVDTLASQSTNQSVATINQSQGFRSTSSVSPGTSPIDLTKPFATAGFVSTLDTTTRVTIDTDEAGGVDYTSAALSTYASVQAFLDEVNASGAGLNANIWYDSTNDRFNVERKNARGANTIDIDDMAAANSFWAAANIDDAAASTNATGLNVGAVLTALNTDTAVAAAAASFSLNGTSIAYTPATDTLQNLIDRINNNSASTGVTSFYDQSLDRVVLTRTTEGPETISLTGDTGNILTALKLTGATTTGSSAIFSINGNTITSSSNTYTFNGITLSLKQGAAAPNGTPAAGDPTANITVTQDTASVATAIKAFATAYNDLAKFYDDNARYNADTKIGGKLFGDSLVNSIEARLKRLLFQSQPALVDTHELLAQIGVQLGDFQTSDANKLVVDDTKLTNAIASNAAAVEQLFGRSTTSGAVKNDGIGFDISEYIADVTEFKGLIDLKEEFFDNKIEDIDARILSEENRLERIERTLRLQFTAMETALAKINAEGGSVVQQLSRL